MEDLQCLFVGLSGYATKLRAHNPAVGAVVVDVGGRQTGSRLTWAVPLLNVPVLQKPKSSIISGPPYSLSVATARNAAGVASVSASASGLPAAWQSNVLSFGRSTTGSTGTLVAVPGSTQPVVPQGLQSLGLRHVVFVTGARTLEEMRGF